MNETEQTRKRLLRPIDSWPAVRIGVFHHHVLYGQPMTFHPPSLVNSAAPIGKTAQLLGKTAAPLGKTAQLLGKTAAPLGKTAQLLGKTAAPLGKTWQLLGKTTAELDKTTVQTANFFL